MNLQRLKFAWARGARIQYRDYQSPWHTTDQIELHDIFNHRIHPDDEHLTYGPLSAAMRETIITGVTHPAFHSATGALVSFCPELNEGWWSLSGEDRLMQFLFLAEYLADEGL